MMGVLIIALAALVGVCAGQMCTQADVRSIFTPCNQRTGLMESIQYFDRVCSANESAVSLSAPRAAPCVRLCPSGTFYSPVTIDCVKCEKGEFSNSGGEIINTFSTFPSRFATYCSPKPCQPWLVSDGSLSIDSGNQSTGVRHSQWYNSEDESVQSTLSTIIDVINPNGGKLMFQYRVESEKNFDGLQLFFNGSLVENPDASVSNARFFATGLHHQWRQAALQLPPGRVEVRFVYSKDANQASEAGVYAGLDRAFLKDFTIEGVQMFAPSCTKCAPGEYADKTGSMDCNVCPKNTYSGAGAPGCTPCADGQWAPVGSSSCVVKQECKAEDYVAVYDACTISPTSPNPQRRRQWKLVSSRCIQTASSMPPSDYVPCALCPTGFHTDSNFACVPCPAGQKFDSVTNACVVCGAGTAAVPIVDYGNGFDTPDGTLDPQLFEMSCEGLCAGCPDGQAYCTSKGEGFEVVPFVNKDEDNTINGIRQTLSNGNSFTSKLTYKFHLTTDGSVFLTYKFIRQGAGTGPVPSALTATITLDGREFLLDKYFSSGDLKGTLMRGLSGPGDYELVFTVSQSGYIAPDDMFAVALLSLVIEGDSRGAANKCSQCKAGHYCPGGTDTYLACSLGTAQPRMGQSRCDACSGNMIAKELASSTCQPCAYGTTVRADHKLCENQCNVTFAGNNYDFSELRGVVFGPLFPAGVRSDLSQDQMDAMNLYRFFISPCSLVNTDKTRTDICSQQFGTLVEDAYACQRLNANRSYSMGDDIHYQFLPSQQLAMRITGGDMCHRANVPRTTNITFVCDPSQDGYGTMQFVNEEPQCQYNFLYTSKYGCPLCTPESYTKVESQCNDDNIRSIAYFRRPYASMCQGGYVPPAAVNYTCEKCKESFYDLVWSDCVDGTQSQSYVLRAEHKGCVDDGKLVFATVGVKKQACTKIDAKIGANRFTFVVLLIIASLCALFYALYTLYHRHTRLQVEYQRLSNNAGEMADMDDEDDTDRLETHNTSTAAVEVEK